MCIVIALATYSEHTLLCHYFSYMGRESIESILNLWRLLDAEITCALCLCILHHCISTLSSLFISLSLHSESSLDQIDCRTNWLPYKSDSTKLSAVQIYLDQIDCRTNLTPQEPGHHFARAASQSERSPQHFQVCYTLEIHCCSDWSSNPWRRTNQFSCSWTHLACI